MTRCVHRDAGGSTGQTHPGARAVLARGGAARCAPPMPPDPVGRLGEASLGLLRWWGVLARFARSARARRRRALRPPDRVGRLGEASLGLLRWWGVLARFARSARARRRRALRPPDPVGRFGEASPGVLPLWGARERRAGARSSRICPVVLRGHLTAESRDAPLVCLRG